MKNRLVPAYSFGAIAQRGKFFPILCALALIVSACGSVHASVITVVAGDVTVNDTTNCSLIDAINAANATAVNKANTTVGACMPTGTPNGGGEGYTSGNVIELAAGAYTLTAAYAPPATYPGAIEYAGVGDGYWYGPDGLPPIATNIVIVGNSAGSTIERSGSATTLFRLFYVGGGESLANYNSPALANLPGPGSLTLVNLTLASGQADGGTSLYGGGGLGAGGAIYNQGSLTLTGDTLTGNVAQGGQGGYQLGGVSYAGAGMGAYVNPNNTYTGGGFYPPGFWPPGNSSVVLGDFGMGGNGSPAFTIGTPGGVGGGGGGAGYFYGGNGGFGGGGGAGHDRGGGGGFGGGGAFIAGSGGFGGGGSMVVGSGGGAGLGGAVFNEGGTVTVVNSTFTNNSAAGGLDTQGSGSGYGGALFNLNGTVTVKFSTFAANVATAGDDVYNLFLSTPGSPAADAGIAAKLTVTSSILGGPLSGSSTISDCENNGGTFTSGYDVVQTAGITCSFTNNDQTGNPELSALAANGGPTQTMTLAAASLAIISGDPTGAPATDQRGASRGNPPDVGAYEYNAGLVITPPGNVTVTAGQTVPVQNFSLSDIFVGAISAHAVSANDTLLPDSDISVSSGCGSDSSHYNCTLTLTPAANQTGTATITLSAADTYGNTAQQSFTLTVNAASPPPPPAPPSSTGGGGGALGLLVLALLGAAFGFARTRRVRVSGTSHSSLLASQILYRFTLGRWR